MQTTPIAIPGVAGWVSVTVPVLGRPAVTVNGMPAQRMQGGDFMLPGAGGAPILVKVKRGPVDPFPSIQTYYGRYPTGPALPGHLKAFAVLPILLVPLGGLLLGAIVALPAFLANMTVSRTTLSNGRKLAAMAAIDLGALLTFILIVAGIVALASLAG
ncbi:hypothetical protein J2S43_002394 [Catenuloplanes nepalensis]|uniref:Uncharacterized protein n=1 Tax=Catenuloplanes nepalensis TaxID=587533 RepID=A0ABT9MR23_9ACTN|nr:hypothetical protein [Catenuloplanes nepalensis]MDP9793882.1 hypothetical protein [Catenuloplanes nepalensis]